jgi:ribosomal protein S21
VVEVRRKDTESFESMYRRFTRKVQQSGILVRARRAKFHEKEKSKNLQRRSAMRRADLTEEREELKRLGKWRGPKSFKKR